MSPYETPLSDSQPLSMSSHRICQKREIFSSQRSTPTSTPQTTRQDNQASSPFLGRQPRQTTQGNMGVLVSTKNFKPLLRPREGRFLSLQISRESSSSSRPNPSE